MKTLTNILFFAVFATLVTSLSPAYADGWRSTFNAGNECLSRQDFKCAFHKFRAAWKIAHDKRDSKPIRVYLSVYHLCFTEIARKKYPGAQKLINALREAILPDLKSTAGKDKFQKLSRDVRNLERALSEARKGKEVSYETGDGNKNRVNTGGPRVNINITLYCANPEGCSRHSSNNRNPGYLDWAVDVMEGAKIPPYRDPLDPRIDDPVIPPTGGPSISDSPSISSPSW